MATVKPKYRQLFYKYRSFPISSNNGKCILKILVEIESLWNFQWDTNKKANKENLFLRLLDENNDESVISWTFNS